MFQTLFARYRQRKALEKSLGWLLRRADDRYLDDIGLTRHDVERMLRHPVAQELPSPRIVRTVCVTL